LFLEHLQHGQGRGAGNRAAGIGAAQAAGSDGVHDLGLAAHAGDREAAADRLGEGGEVRDDAQLLGGEEGAGTAGTGLYFVGDQHDAVLVAQGAQALHEGRGVDVEAAFTLHRLDDDRGDVAGLGVVLEDALDAGDGVVFADAVQRARSQGTEDAARHQAHAGGVGHDLAGQAQGHHGAAVVGAGEGDHAGTAGGGTGDLHGVLDGFGAGGDQQGLLGEVARHALGDLFAQLDVGLVGHDLEAGVAQLAQLLLNGGDHFRVQVAGVQYGDAAGEIDVLTTVNVPNGGILGALGDDRVDLTNATRNSGGTTLQEGFVLAHVFLISRFAARSKDDDGADPGRQLTMIEL